MYVLGERDLYDALWNLRMNEQCHMAYGGMHPSLAYSGERNQKKERERKNFYFLFPSRLC